MGSYSQAIGGLQTTLFPYLRLDSYQRSLTWDNKLQAAFIISVINDWPVGIIVLNKIDSKGTTNKGIQLSATHDIIDGQQRLSTLKDFLENPLIYVYKWQTKEPEDEPILISDMRNEFDILVKKLKNSKNTHLAGKTKEEVREWVFNEARIDFRRKLFGEQINNKEFEELIGKMNGLYVRVCQTLIAIQETEVDSQNAEKMYQAINTHGEPVEWWELLRAGDYHKIKYESTSNYSVRYTSIVTKLSKLYFENSKFKPKEEPTYSPSLWDALYALGEYYQLLYRGHDPTKITKLIDRNNRKLKVDGLGFRLVSGLLSHEVSRVAINRIIDDYDVSTILKAIDGLFITADALFIPAISSKYKLFYKYSLFGAEIIPAYPQLSLIIMAAQIMLVNNRSTLNEIDQDNLRILSEEIFRESICTDKWNGTADKKMKEWLDKYLYSSTKTGQNEVTSQTKPFPGGIRNIIVDPLNMKEWCNFIESIEPVRIRNVPKDWQYFYFFIQYLWDSNIPGTLPRTKVSYDHIVAYNDANPLTTHPYNFCAIDTDLNTKKARRSYNEWNPSGTDKSNYELQCVNNPKCADAPVNDFLEYADIVDIEKMIEMRKELLRFCLTTMLKRWIVSGDKY